MIKKPSFINDHLQDIYATYRKIKVIGHGSYGQVFRLQKKSTGEFFACKKLLKSKIKNKTNFHNEIMLLKNTDHPNIIKLYDIYEDSTSLYLIMEECMGGEFFNRLSKRSKEKNMYTEKEAAGIFRQILEAINYLHTHGVCHRDIKPENILFSTIEEDSAIKLIDFGLSKVAFNSGKEMTDSVGTLFYMAPEVISGKYNEKCDVWSCGIILYIMLTGVPPFYSKNDDDLKQKILSMKYNLDNPNLKKVSVDARRLIKSILVEQSIRPSVSQLLETKWIKELAPNSSEAVLSIDWGHILKYSKLNLVQKCVINFASFRLSDKETEGLIEMFKSLDKNSDGLITLEELRAGAENWPLFQNKLSLDDLIEMFNEIDVDQNGFVNFTEFISSLINYESVLKKERLIDCFKNYDVDGNGKISFTEFVDMIRPKDENESLKIKNLFTKFDKNGDGDIDFEEFLEGVMDMDFSKDY
ncbi:MAG: protein kinase [archaeon]|nr:protein kinase [archaeon]